MADAFLPFHTPEIGDEEVSAVAEALRSGWITAGPRVAEFESAFAGYVGAPHAIAVNSGTAALHLALEAVGGSGGDEVIVPTLTVAASAGGIGRGACRGRGEISVVGVSLKKKKNSIEISE